MPRSRPWDETGSASLEFITAGLVLLLPLVYLVLSMAALQGGALSVEGASRQAARVFVQSPSAAIGSARARSAVEAALDDFGIAHDRSVTTISCRPIANECLTRRGYVTVTVVATVSLPFAPAATPVSGPWQIPMSATSTEQVSRLWGASG